MQVRVLYFAAARDAAGRKEEALELPEGATLQTLLDELTRLHPEIGRLRPALRVAVDESYQAVEYVLRGGEEVALIPPVAGGS
ncbi:molybdopterin converting factor subunit 1 [Limnochorda pilosa]|uniref:Molybdopterin synthase sulfur carrier subunit n=1 Tax=Limnochorda pilosa TaxID=1555112 RepID=A0A0K2SG06_LIMPI|nr:molybdopterin converting factor subunit 1 [Limnochorda pilosa]BAS26036.1 molybdopterin converting factor [Limnochorda pilosa]